MLTQDGSENLNWTWAGATPDHWSIQSSFDGVSGWTEVDTQPGSFLGPEPVTGWFYYRVVGKDSGGSDITPDSNVVFVP